MLLHCACLSRNLFSTHCWNMLQNHKLVHLWKENSCYYIILCLGFAYNSMCILKITQCWRRYKSPIINWLFCGGFLHWCCQSLGWRHWETFTGLAVANSHKHNIECVVPFSHCQDNCRGEWSAMKLFPNTTYRLARVYQK